LTQAKGKLDEAAADVSYMQTLVSKCTITAPFDGRVSKRHAAAWQYMTPGAPVLDIVATQDLELRMLVPSKWLPRLNAGATFQVTIDELGQTFPAKRCANRPGQPDHSGDWRYHRECGEFVTRYEWVGKL